MKHLRLIFSIIIALLLVSSTLGQSRFYGTVTEVIDGKTLVVEPQPQIKIRIELQYIEVPEPEQSLHLVVKSHLSNLVLNKKVEFRPKNINETTKPIGQIMLNGVDVSQQMLRDGAAWYSAAEKDIQGEVESKVYQHNESLAKNEKRGVWSIPDLKPAWEFRAAKVEKIRQEELRKKKEEEEERARLEAIKTKEKKTQDRINAETARNLENDGSIWVDVYGLDILTRKIPRVLKENVSPEVLRNATPIRGFDENTNRGYVATRLSKMNMHSDGEDFVIYGLMINLFENEDLDVKNNRYIFRFFSEADKEIFSTQQTLKLTLAKRNVSLKVKEKIVETYNGRSREMIEFDISEKLADYMRTNAIYELSIGDYKEGKMGMFTGRVLRLFTEQTL